MMRRAASLMLFIGLAAAGGCGVFRPLPSHGGGKRFDEEQRIVAQSIRYALADMDLRELEGKKVAISLEMIAQDGGGTVQFPGLSSVSAGVSGSVGQGNVVQFTPGVTGTRAMINDNSSNSVGGNIGVGIRPDMYYCPTAMSTTADGAYLKAALEMKARHAGLAPGAAAPDCTLYVLVDVLGTNRSHFDNLLLNTEKLAATCECTYYAVDNKTNELIFRARRASSSAAYSETRGWGVKGSIVSRIAGRSEATLMPVDAEHKPASQPTTSTARKNSWFDDLVLRVAGIE